MSQFLLSVNTAKMSESQQKTLMSEGVTRHVREKCPLSGHSVLFMTRAWELGRMAAYIKKNSSVEEHRAFQDKVRYSKEVGWLRDISEPYIHVLDDSPEGLERTLTGKEEYKKDEGELHMFQLFSEGVEDLYAGMIEKVVRSTPELWEDFAVRNESGEFYLVDPDTKAPTTADPTSRNICLDIHNNVQFSPKMCLWAIGQKLESTKERFSPGQFAEFCYRELKEYVESRDEVYDSLYQNLVTNTQSRTFEDETYVNTVGSKVVIKPIGEVVERLMKKEKALQRPMEITQPEKASSAQDVTGYLPSGEIPGVSTASTAGYLSSGKIPGAQAAESTEDLPSGEISVKEAKEEDVEMNSTQDEEVPQDEHMQDVEEVDYGGSEEETEEQLLQFELKRIDEEIQKDKDRRQETHQQQREAEGRQEQQQDMKEEEHTVPTTFEEVKVYQEELETRKKIDIFALPSSANSLRLLKNDTTTSTTESQVKMETIFVEQGKKSKKPFQRKIQTSLDSPLEREPRVKVMSVPQPVPRGEEQDIIEHESPLDGLM